MECRKSISLIVLAAGDSKRFHENKLLYPIHGKRMFEFVIDEINRISQSQDEIGVEYHTIVVTQYEEVKNYCNKYGFQIQENRQSFLGISASIQLGVKAQTSDAYLFVAADQPYLKEATIHAVIDLYMQGQKGMVGVKSGNEYGTPNLFDMRYREELLSLSGDVGGRKIMKQFPEDVIYYEVQDTKELLDIDTKERCEFE